MHRHHHHHDAHGQHHDHDDRHDHDHHDHGHDRTQEPHRWAGHNHAQPPRAIAQWQTPHLAHGGQEQAVREVDLDKVESVFVESFLTASDQASFVRLARIPFEVILADRTRLQLLRVEVDALTDVGSLTPHLGGESFRYDPLPAGLISQRRRLRFVYFDGQSLRHMTFAETRSIEGTGF
jgi:hypothetical protein